MLLSRLWPGWRRPLRLVKPETVIAWHRLGFEVNEATVARYMIKRRGRPTQDWKTFLTNHLGATVAVDFLTVPTVMF